MIDANCERLADTHDIPVTAENRALIDERLAEAEKSPDDQHPWEEVRVHLGLSHR
jgi:hypothetical protein